MATYIYETTDSKPARRFEVRQSMNDKPFTHDPDSGRPVRRVISGGYGLMGVAKAGGEEPSSGGSSCGSGCGCH